MYAHTPLFCISAKHPERESKIDLFKSDGDVCGEVGVGGVVGKCKGDERGEGVREWGVGCWWGKGRGGEKCGEVGVVSGVGKGKGKIRWDGAVGGYNVVVPQYAWTHNIYHFARQWLNVWRVLDERRRGLIWGEDGVKSKKVWIGFKRVGVWGGDWHKGFRELVVEILRRSLGDGGAVDVGFLYEDNEMDSVCVEDAVVLGGEWDDDAFLFLNGSRVRSSPPMVGSEALRFKEEVRRTLGFDNRVKMDGSKRWIKVPPKVVGYLVRVAKDKGVLGKGKDGGRKNLREFYREDEVWFQNILKGKVEKYGLQLKIVDWDERNYTFAQQVGLMQGIGAAVGIHGANLVNSMFMPSFGALFEIMPYHYPKAYYYAGSNSGLRYSSHDLIYGKEHNCSEYVWCHLPYRDIEIRLSNDDRVSVEKHLEDLCEYLAEINRKYPSGWAPLRKLDQDTLEIDAFWFRESPVAVDHWGII